MKTVEIKFSIGDLVRLKELGDTGRVMSILVAGHILGHEYKIRFFNNGEEKIVWFFEDDIEVSV